MANILQLLDFLIIGSLVKIDRGCTQLLDWLLSTNDSSMPSKSHLPINIYIDSSIPSRDLALGATLVELYCCATLRLESSSLTNWKSELMLHLGDVLLTFLVLHLCDVLSESISSSYMIIG
jgi:hypothetical protein